MEMPPVSKVTPLPTVLHAARRLCGAYRNTTMRGVPAAARDADSNPC
jgi:hypothetical protein